MRRPIARRRLTVAAPAAVRRSCRMVCTRRAAFVLLFVTAFATGAAAQIQPPPEGAPSTPALERLLVDGGRIERVATGLSFAEGPVWLDPGLLVFTDVPAGRILRWRANQVTTWIEESGGAYGLAKHPEGGLVAAQYGARQVSRLDPAGTFTVLAREHQGRPLNGPTDVAVARDGTIYFADPVQGQAPAGGARSAVYRINADGVVDAIITDVRYPNGLALSEDGRTLYVSDGPARQVRAYEIAPDGGVGSGRVLASVHPWKRGVLGVPDGIAIDEAGRLFLAGPGGIWVLDANGGRLGVIAMPETPSNCAFGGEDGRTLYITARTSVYRVRLKVAGSG